MSTKARVDKLVLAAGEITTLDTDGQDYVRIVVEEAGPANSITVSGRLKDQKQFVFFEEIIGEANIKIKVSTYEEVKLECTNFDSISSTIKVIASSFKQASGSAIQLDVPAGDSITDIEILNLTSSDDSLIITGDNTSKSIDLKVNLSLDGIQEYPTLLDFPLVGQASTLYVALDTEKIYRFAELLSDYIEVSPSTVTSVNTKTGNVILDKSDIGLSNVDNTSDAQKVVSGPIADALAALSSSGVYSVNGLVGDVFLTKDDLELSNVDNTSDLDKPISTDTQDALDLKADISNVYTTTQADSNFEPKNSNIQTHISSTSNPHSVTKAQIGLDNVDNTSDLNKPISTATQNALDLKANSSDVYTKTQSDANYEPKDTNIQNHISNLSNPHFVTKSQVGLSNVDNTSDLNKPISNATQTALDLKANNDLTNLIASPTLISLQSSYVFPSDITFNQSSTDVIIRGKSFAEDQASNNMSIFSGATSNALSGEVNIFSGNTFLHSVNPATGSTGNVSFSSGEVAAGTGVSGSARLSSGVTLSGNSGNVQLNSGSTTSGTSGDATIKSGNTTSGTSGNVLINSGESFSGASGNILISSGIAGTTRGKVQIEASKAEFLNTKIEFTGSNQKIEGLANGTIASDAVNKGQLDTKVSKSGDTITGLLTINNIEATALSANNLRIGNPWGAGVSVITVVDNNTDELLIQSADMLVTSGIPSKRAIFQSGWTDDANSANTLILTGNVTSGNGSSGNIEMASGTASGTGLRGYVSVDARSLTMLGTTPIINVPALYFGDPFTNGTYRIRMDGSNLVTERLEFSVWVVKQTITPTP